MPKEVIVTIQWFPDFLKKNAHGNDAPMALKKFSQAAQELADMGATELTVSISDPK